MKTNVKNACATRTHEGGLSAAALTPAQELRRTVMCCLLWEDSFYEAGVSSTDRIKALLKKTLFSDAAQIAIDAREKMKLRHVPLFMVRELLRYHSGRMVGDLVARVIQRPDEMGELLALYWKDGKDQPLSSQLKIGLARALKKFNEYSIGKYINRDASVKIRDVLFLSHAKPKNGEQAALFKKIADNTVATPDTWEVELSGGADKKATFERLMSKNKLGALALLRNLRGMLEAGVSEDVIRDALGKMKVDRVLPFRFIAAARHAPRLEDALELAMFRCLSETPKLGGKTALLIDHSGSMSCAVSSKSEISRFDAAAALAMILRETTDRCRVFTFAEDCVEVPPRRGFAMVQAVQTVINPVATKLGKAVKHVYAEFPECDRIIVITDEQSEDRPQHPQGRGYIINVAGYANGVGYGPWITISGWSESINEYILACEESNAERN